MTDRWVGNPFWHNRELSSTRRPRRERGPGIEVSNLYNVAELGFQALFLPIEQLHEHGPMPPLAQQLEEEGMTMDLYDTVADILASNPDGQWRSKNPVPIWLGGHGYGIVYAGSQKVWVDDIDAQVSFEDYTNDWISQYSVLLVPGSPDCGLPRNGAITLYLKQEQNGILISSISINEPGRVFTFSFDTAILPRDCAPVPVKASRISEVRKFSQETETSATNAYVNWLWDPENPDGSDHQMQGKIWVYRTLYPSGRRGVGSRNTGVLRAEFGGIRKYTNDASAALFGVTATSEAFAPGDASTQWPDIPSQESVTIELGRCADGDRRGFDFSRNSNISTGDIPRPERIDEDVWQAFVATRRYRDPWDLEPVKRVVGGLFRQYGGFSLKSYDWFMRHHGMKR